MASVRGMTRWSVVLLVGVGAAACTPPAGVSTAPGSTLAAATPSPGQGSSPADQRMAAYRQLLRQLETFHVAGGVRTEEGLILPETVTIEIRSEVCVESREPGTRFWSLDYDTCFTYVSLDSLDAQGEYEVSVPCLDADRGYESRHAFGDLRLVQRGPVSFLASSDAGWRHQETFTSSRSQRRDLLLNLEPDTFWIVTADAVFHSRPRAGADVLGECAFGTALGVVRFHQGWAECVRDRTIGWVEMRHLGTEEEMRLREPLLGRPVPKRRPVSEPPLEDAP